MCGQEEFLRLESFTWQWLGWSTTTGWRVWYRDVMKVLAARVPERLHRRMPLEQSISSCLLYTRNLPCQQSRRLAFRSGQSPYSAEIQQRWVLLSSLNIPCSQRLELTPLLVSKGRICGVSGVLVDHCK